MTSNKRLPADAGGEGLSLREGDGCRAQAEGDEQRDEANYCFLHGVSPFG